MTLPGLLLIRRDFSGTAGTVKLSLLLTACLTIMSGATIAPSLPAITEAFSGTDNIELLSRLVLTLPALFVAISSPFIGKIADRVGRTRLLVACIVLYTVAGTTGLYLGSVYGLLAGRAFLGVAVAGIMTLGTALAGDHFNGAERDRYMGFQQAFTGVGGLVFLTAGGFLADFDWRYPFAIYALALPLAPLVWRVLFEPKREASVSRADDPETDGSESIVPLCIVALLVSGCFYVIPSQLPYQLNELGIAAPSIAGLSIGLLTLMATMASLAYGPVRERIGPNSIFAIGLTAMAAGLALIGISPSLVGVLCGTGITGLGQGLIMPNILARAMSASPSHRRGRIAGLVTACLFIGQFISPLLSQPAISLFGYTSAFYGSAVLTLMALIPVMASRVRYAKSGSSRLRTLSNSRKEIQ